MENSFHLSCARIRRSAVSQRDGVFVDSTDHAVRIGVKILAPETQCCRVHALAVHAKAHIDTYAHATAQMKKESADRMQAHIQAIKSCKG